MTIGLSQSGDEFRVRDEFRNGIEFTIQDIRHEQPAGPFDIIFCRHLTFTYFDEPLQLDVLQEILTRLQPHGLLVIGKQEPLPTGADYLEPYAPHSGVYRRKATAPDSTPPP